MNTTPVSLLERLRQPAEQAAWTRFVDLYTPLLYAWARRLGLQPQDAADVVQEVFVVLVRKLPEFAYDPGQSFRGWLRTVLHNKWRNFRRQRERLSAGAAAELDQLAGPEEPLELEETEYRQHLIQRALQLLQAEFQPTTWKAWWEYVVCGRPVADVAQELGISTNAVYLAKSRVLGRLRAELDGLLN
jgi:RNA polymerase sigma-70 factor (ECF subfamily)